MVRTEISLFLENVPGELAKLTAMLEEAGMNIDALTIQDASEYVQALFKARGKSLKRVAPAASYGSMKKDSADHALIRLLAENTDKVIDLLSRKGYLFDIFPVIALEIENRPGKPCGNGPKIRRGRDQHQLRLRFRPAGQPESLIRLQPRRHRPGGPDFQRLRA